MARGILGALLFCALAAGCGGRSAIGTSIPGQRDGGLWPDGVPVYRDARPWKKDVWPVKLDRAFVKDWTPPPDLGCLPIPAGQATGTYQGAWKGTLSCPGMAQQTMSGTLKVSLSKIGGTSASFNVKGSLEGQLDPGLPVAGSFSGKMTCTALSATVPSVTIGSGAIVYKLNGGINGTFAKTGTGTGWGFPGGVLEIKDSSLGCVASGSWYANK
jgi:hypothetical protein